VGVGGGGVGGGLWVLRECCGGGGRGGGGGGGGGGGSENRKTAQKYAKKTANRTGFFSRIPKLHVHGGHNMKPDVSKTCDMF